MKVIRIIDLLKTLFKQKFKKWRKGEERNIYNFIKTHKEIVNKIWFLWGHPFVAPSVRIELEALSLSLSNQCINANKLMYHAANGQPSRRSYDITFICQELAVSEQNSIVCNHDAWTERHVHNTEAFPSCALINSGVAVRE